MRHRVFLLFAVLLCALSLACGGDDDDSTAPSSLITPDDDGADDDASDDDAGDDDTWPPLPDDDVDDDADDDVDDDDADDDNDDDVDDDADDDADDDDLPDPPDDGRLYVAAGATSISPTVENHPGPWYLGGASFRIATVVHLDLTASALILAKGSEHAVLVSLDLVGFPQSRIEAIAAALAERGVDAERVFVSSTHTHGSIDTVGLWGEDYFHTARDETYQQFIVDTVVDLVTDVWFELTPASVAAGETVIEDVASNYPTYIRDSRRPYITKPEIAAARFTDDEDNTIASVVNWNTHPEVNIGATEVSSDFPHYTRLALEAAYGGTAIYFSGAVGGLQTPLSVQIPELTEEGEPVLDGGDPVYISGGDWPKTWSMGYHVAGAAMEALNGATADAAPAFAVRSTWIDIPATNIALLAALLTGLVESPPELTFFDPDCGGFACLRERIGALRVGPLVITTSPGETFPETLVGRTESTFDHGEPWGEFVYPAMFGVEETLPHAAIPMHLGLCGDETGYIVPQSDFHDLDHPDFYEEFYSVGWRMETIYREAMTQLVAGL